MPQDHSNPGVLRRRRLGWLPWLIAVAAALLIAADYRDHFYGLLPFGLLALCPLMHGLMHRGHGVRNRGGAYARGPVADARRKTRRGNARA